MCVLLFIMFLLHVIFGPWLQTPGVQWPLLVILFNSWKLCGLVQLRQVSGSLLFTCCHWYGYCEYNVDHASLSQYQHAVHFQGTTVDMWHGC
jgi:hypothetical protein